MAQTPTPAGDHDGNPAAEAAEAVHGHEVPAGASEVAHHGGEGGGLPQFRFEYWGGQIIWLLILFALLYVLLARVFVPRLRKVLDTRQETISAALEEARRVKGEADGQAEAVTREIEQARAEARRRVAEAKAKAQEDLARSQAAEDARLAERVAEAEARIRALRDESMSNVQGIATDAAAAIVEKLTGAPAKPAEIAALGAVRT